MNIDNTEISKVLGQRISAPEQYDKSILVRELRQNNRSHLNLYNNKLPFVGVDLWNNWEISALTNNGLPVTGIAKITYSCESKYIVESKSAKLYFNSFNMTRMGSHSYEVINNIEKQSTEDLSEFLETDVKVQIRSSTSACNLMRTDNYYIDSILLDNLSPSIDVYKEDPSLLRDMGNTSSLRAQKFHSTVLRSNCRVTNQPDAGDVYIYINSNTIVDPESLLKYIVSFRGENHFHEEVCEAIYVRLLDRYNPYELMVSCFYVRRGSLDINPIRASHSYLIPSDFTDDNVFYIKTPRQ